MTRRILLSLAFSIVTFSAAAQEARNAAFVELGGNGIALTVNYERRFSELWAGRVGFSSVESESDTDSDTTLIFPITVSRISRPSSSHHMELGGGVTLVTGDAQDLFDDWTDEDEEISNVALTGILGYRYQKPSGGFQFRAAFTPIFFDGEIAPWAGVSFGYAW